VCVAASRVVAPKVALEAALEAARLVVARQAAVSVAASRVVAPKVALEAALVAARLVEATTLACSAVAQLGGLSRPVRLGGAWGVIRVLLEGSEASEALDAAVPWVVHLRRRRRLADRGAGSLGRRRQCGGRRATGRHHPGRTQ
jgi:hypothetical protein